MSAWVRCNGSARAPESPPTSAGVGHASFVVDGHAHITCAVKPPLCPSNDSAEVTGVKFIDQIAALHSQPISEVLRAEDGDEHIGYQKATTQFQ